MQRLTQSLTFIIGVFFVILKLTDVVSWPWIWVLSPFWIGFAILILVFVIIGAGFVATTIKE